MKKLILLFLLLPLLSCGLKKEISTLEEQNTELATKNKELEAKNAELEKKNASLYQQNQKDRRRISQLLREQRTRRNSSIEYETMEPPVSGTEQIFSVVEQMPTFPGGTNELHRYIRRAVRYPQLAMSNNVEGRVYVQFVVEKDGSITNVKVIRGIGSGCDKESIRVVKSMPKWNPAKQRGKTVRAKMTLPISFNLK